MKSSFRDQYVYAPSFEEKVGRLEIELAELGARIGSPVSFSQAGSLSVSDQETWYVNALADVSRNEGADIGLKQGNWNLSIKRPGVYWLGISAAADRAQSGYKSCQFQVHHQGSVVDKMGTTTEEGTCTVQGPVRLSPGMDVRAMVGHATGVGSLKFHVRLWGFLQTP
ncbi:MAG: hypothetical protein FJX11_12915 [Alphaproteobacteria bacterium]|nr:hypothetical protein [Alphaproteobacteria bacterium]